MITTLIAFHQSSNPYFKTYYTKFAKPKDTAFVPQNSLNMVNNAVGGLYTTKGCAYASLRVLLAEQSINFSLYNGLRLSE